MKAMRAIRPISKRRGERGQTILLVVISLLSLLAMAALAIDVVTLYLARAEIQRAADAVALAGAKAMADSGVTTDPGQVALAQDMANKVITSGGANGILQQNLVSGRPPQLVGSPVFEFVAQGNSNPTITVTLQQTNLPIFFARIWRRGLATVSASSTAEAYNPSNSQSILGATTPITPHCVKPWLIPNVDPDPGHSGNGFVNRLTGAVTSPGVYPTGIIGERFKLTSYCPFHSPNCVNSPVPPPAMGDQYLPAQVLAGTIAGPSCSTGGTLFEQAVAGCDPTPYFCGGSVPNTTVDTTISDPGTPGGDTDNGVQCLIHASGPDLGQGQDTIDTSAYPSEPIQIKAGSANPLIGAGSPVATNSLMTTSSSIVTIPVFDQQLVTSGSDVLVIGFLQVFIEYVHEDAVNNKTEVHLAVLNVSGCGNTLAPPPTGPILGGGVSPVPVRLIHQ